MKIRFRYLAVFLAVSLFITAFTAKAESQRIMSPTSQEMLYADLDSLYNISCGVSANEFLVQKDEILRLTQEVLDISFMIYPETNFNDRARGLLYLLKKVDSETVYADKVVAMHSFMTEVRRMNYDVLLL